jgi:hypothetical protein
MRIDDVCRGHCSRIVEDECGCEPHEQLYMVAWEVCMEECYRIAEVLLLGVGGAVVEACLEKGLYVEPPAESWVLGCVKKYLADMSHYSDLVGAIIGRMATHYEKVFRAFWEERWALQGRGDRAGCPS